MTPTPQRQAAFVGAAFVAAPVGAILRNPRNLIRSWKMGAATIQSWTELAGSLPALGSSHKFGVRYGGAGVTTIGETFLGNMYMGGTPEASLPIPTFGFWVSPPFQTPHLDGCMNRTSRGPVSILAVAGHQKPANPCWGPRHRKGSHRHPPKKDGVAEPACGSVGGTACGSPDVPSLGVVDIRKDTGVKIRESVLIEYPDMGTCLGR